MWIMVQMDRGNEVVARNDATGRLLDLVSTAVSNSIEGAGEVFRPVRREKGWRRKYIGTYEWEYRRKWNVWSS